MTWIDETLNFVIPVAVVLFLMYIIYRIPIVTQMVAWISNKFSEMRERRQSSGTDHSSKVQTIQYE